MQDQELSVLVPCGGTLRMGWQMGWERNLMKWPQGIYTFLKWRRLGETARDGESRWGVGVCVEGGGLLAGTREGKPTCSIDSEIGYVIIFLLAPSNYTNTGQWDIIYVHRIREELRVTGNVLHFPILVMGASETRSGQGTNVTQKFYFSSSAREKKKKKYQRVLKS